MDLSRESLCRQVIGELSEFVEIDAWPEPEGMENRPRRRTAWVSSPMEHIPKKGQQAAAATY
jgi:hypothetical protein